MTLGAGNPTSAIITATESNYDGAFAESDDCTNTPNGGETYTVATITAANRGSWTVAAGPVVPVPPGSVSSAYPLCIATIADDHGGSAQVSITNAQLGIIIETKGRKK